MTAALILAGATNDGPLKEISDASNEALIEINGRPMIDYVVEAVAEVPNIKRVLIVGPKEDLAEKYAGVEIIQNSGSILDNVEKGLNHLADEEEILIATADIPMITTEAIKDFISQCRQREADFYYPINSKEVSEAFYPGGKRTYIKMKEGVFTGGNVFLVKTKPARSSLPKAKQFIAMRKKPFQLAMILGLSFIFRFITKTLPIAAAEKRVSEILGMKGVAILSPYGEIGVDVDKREDMKAAEDLLLS